MKVSRQMHYDSQFMCCLPTNIPTFTNHGIVSSFQITATHQFQWQHTGTKCIPCCSCVPLFLAVFFRLVVRTHIVCVLCVLLYRSHFQQNKLICALPATLPFWQRLLRGEKWWSKSKIQSPVFCFRRHTVYCTAHKTPKQPPDAAAITLHQNTLSRIQK